MLLLIIIRKTVEKILVPHLHHPPLHHPLHHHPHHLNHQKETKCVRLLKRGAKKKAAVVVVEEDLFRKKVAKTKEKRNKRKNPEKLEDENDELANVGKHVDAENNVSNWIIPIQMT